MYRHTIQASLKEMNKAYGKHGEVREAEGRYYLRVSLCDDFQFDLCLPEEIAMSGPGEFYTPEVMLSMDLSGFLLVARLGEQYQNCVTGITLLRAKNIYDGDEIPTFCAADPDDATHALVCAKWPIGNPPAPTTLAAEKKRLNALLYGRFTDDDCAYGMDSWILPSLVLDQEIMDGIKKQNSVLVSASYNLWKAFEICKPYYRECMADLLQYYDRLSELYSMDEDYLVLNPRSDTDADLCEKIWYNEDGLDALSHIAQTLLNTFDDSGEVCHKMLQSTRTRIKNRHASATKTHSEAMKGTGANGNPEL